MNRFFTFLLDLIYPPKCIFCGNLLWDEEKGWCGDCQESLPWIGEDVPEKACAPVTRCAAPLWYRDEVRDSFHRYKFDGRHFYAQAYGELMVQCVRDRLGTEFDLICWAPLSPKRRRERGYDQAGLLARVLAQSLDRPLVPALRKIRDTAAQSSLGGDDARAQNAAGAYECADPAAVRGRRVLLVDDIVTTGSTLSNCARVLLDAGAREVWAAVFARARR